MDWRNQLPVIQNKVKSQLHARKIDDLESVRRLIEEFDADGNGVLDKVEFGKLLSKAGIYLSTQELTCVYNCYDTNKDGYINYVEFVQLIRTEMSEKRLAAVKHAFQFLDEHRAKRLPIEDLLKLYRAAEHPRVRTREKTPEQVFAEFKNAIIKKSFDKIYITEAEFLDYYADVNATLPSDKEEYFIDLVLKTWGVTTGSSYVSPQRIAELETIVYEKIRQRTSVKDDEGKTIKKAFKYFDLDDTGLIDLNKFNFALEKFGCVFNKNEIIALFKKYDKDESGKLCYDEFCNMFAIIGSGSNPNVNPVFELTRDYPKELLEQIKKDIRKKGLYGNKQVRQIFTKNDKLKRGAISRSDFGWAAKEAGLNLFQHDLEKLYKYFDKKADNQVNYEEFLQILRGDLTQQRAYAIQSAWERVSGGADTVPYDQFIKSFDPYGQPEVRANRYKPDLATKEFVAEWASKKNGQISYQDFFDLYWDVSAVIPDDATFESLVRDSWRANQLGQTGASQFAQTGSSQFGQSGNIQPQVASPGNVQQVASPGNVQQVASPGLQKTSKNLTVRFADDLNINK